MFTKAHTTSTRTRTAFITNRHFPPFMYRTKTGWLALNTLGVAAIIGATTVGATQFPKALQTTLDQRLKDAPATSRPMTRAQYTGAAVGGMIACGGPAILATTVLLGYLGLKRDEEEPTVIVIDTRRPATYQP